MKLLVLLLHTLAYFSIITGCAGVAVSKTAWEGAGYGLQVANGVMFMVMAFRERAHPAEKPEVEG